MADDELLSRHSAILEARCLLKLLETGSTVEGLRQLIVVPARSERAMRAFSQAHEEEAYFMDRAVMFRKAVLDEFNRLVRAGAARTDVEVEETELRRPRRWHVFDYETSNQISKVLLLRVKLSLGRSPPTTPGIRRIERRKESRNALLHMPRCR